MQKKEKPQLKVHGHNFNNKLFLPPPITLTIKKKKKKKIAAAIMSGISCSYETAWNSVSSAPPPHFAHHRISCRNKHREYNGVIRMILFGWWWWGWFVFCVLFLYCIEAAWQSKFCVAMNQKQQSSCSSWWKVKKKKKRKSFIRTQKDVVRDLLLPKNTQLLCLILMNKKSSHFGICFSSSLACCTHLQLDAVRPLW